MTSTLRQHIDDCFAKEIGIGKSVFDARLNALAPLLEKLKAGHCKQSAALMARAGMADDLADIIRMAEDIRARFKHVVVIGSGGSGLSGRMLVQASAAGVPSGMHFIENIDPDLMDQLLAKIDMEQSCFIIVSKSGGTAETLSQFFALWHHMQQAMGAAAGKHFIVVTADAKSPLGLAAAKNNIRIIGHPADIGGRFSWLTVPGLLPAAICGMDIKKIRAGAASVVKTLGAAKDAGASPPACGAALQHAAMEAKKSISVMLAYSERLSGFSAWYRQSWAESLGKNGKGTTPIRAVGSTDQHSQLQLYLDGPKDKFFTLVTLPRAGRGLAIHAPQPLTYLNGKTLGDVMDAEQQATIATLKKNHCPVRVIELETLDEETTGALLMHFTLEIICMAELLGVNAFDQPAVEEGKILAREYLLGAAS